jgi:putative PIN family toxin of toxin-antitoxin system
MKVVLDTNVLVAGLRSRDGASFQILSAISKEIFELLISVPLFLEYEGTLKRVEHLRKTGLTLSDIDVVLDFIAARATHVSLYFLWRPLLPDPSDDMVLELAVAGEADTVVTFNLSDFAAAKETHGLSILSPSDFWRLLKKKGLIE